MTKKLIYILNHYSANSTSHYFHIINLLEKIADNGVKVALIIEKADDIPVFKNPNVRVYPVKTSNKYFRPLKEFLILNYLYKEKYQKIFVRITTGAAITAIIFSRFKTIDTYYWNSGTMFDFEKEKPFSITKIIQSVKFGVIKQGINHFVTGPESMGDYYVNFCNVKRNKIMILYNDVDINRFTANNIDKSAIKKELGIDADTKILLFVRRLSPIKGILFYLPYIMEQFHASTIDNYVTIIIGDGPERNKLENVLKNHPLRGKVLYLGAKPNAIVQQYYQIADIFLNATLEEGFPRVLIEAMATGLPVVTTDAGGIKDILPEEQKEFMVEKNDRDAFVKALLKLSLDTEKQNLLREANRNYVQRFSTENVAQMYVNKIFY
jgi:glycosyltransferase involved in cell wall biosynthesis